MDPAAVSAPLVDALLGAGYRPGGPAGIGGRGPVWTATRADDRTGGPDARVVVQVVDLPDADAAARLRHRLDALTEADHPHLPRVVDLVPVPVPVPVPGRAPAAVARGGAGTGADPDRERTWAVLLGEVPGATVAALLASRGRLSAGEVVTLTVPLAGALDALHRCGLVHGDVSPANVVVRPDGRPVLIDVLGGPGGAGDPCRGTPGFTAPERSRPRPATTAEPATGPDGLPADAPADVYALGCVALAALDLSSHAGRLGDELRAACAPDPVRRPTAAELAGAVFACAEPEPITQPDAGVLARTALAQLAAPSRTVSVRTGGRHRARHAPGRRSRRAAVAAAAAAAVVAIAAGWVLTHGDPGTTPAGILAEAPPGGSAAGEVPEASDVPVLGVPDAPAAKDVPDVPDARDGSGGPDVPDGSGGSDMPDGSGVPDDPARPDVPDGLAAPGAPDGPGAADGPVPAATRRADPVAAAVALTRRRAEVLAAGDRTLLAEVARPGSPAHRADTALLDRLAAAGVGLEGVAAEVVDASPAAPSAGSAPGPSPAVPQPPGTADVRVTSGLGAHTRRSPSGVLPVPAQPARTVVLRLAWTDDGWRVVSVRPG